MAPRPSRRGLLRVAALAPALFATPACAAQAAGAVSLPDYRRPGDLDDTAALARAFATGRPVHAPAGRYVVGNDGTATLPPRATLTGDGVGRTVFARSYRAPKPFILFHDSGSADPARNLAGLTIRDLTFEDEVERRGFEEFAYLVMLNGVSDALFERVGFRGFRGDGLHLGSGTTLGAERHNRRVTVRDCVFDGVNANNRNAISIIDGDGIVIERSRFLNCTRYGDGSAGAGDPMNPRTGLGAPGAIDVEPNGDAFAVVRDITIRGNRFTGGGGYAVALMLGQNGLVTTPHRGIRILDNILEDRVGGIQAFAQKGDRAATIAIPYDIDIRGNTLTRVDKPLLIDGIRGATIARNAFTDCAGHAELGYAATIADVTLADNLFTRSGSAASWFALWVRDSVALTIARNAFVDIGTPGQRKGAAIAFVAGTARRLTLTANRFASPTGRMAQAVTVFDGAHVDRAGLVLGQNDITFAAPSLADVLR